MDATEQKPAAGAETDSDAPAPDGGAADAGLERLEGTIAKVFLARPRFSAGVLTTAQGKDERFAGNFLALEGQEVALLGEWGTHETYGRQFEVQGLDLGLEMDPQGLARYLANHPQVKGIGDAKARQIVQTFGGRLEQSLLDDPAQVARAANLPQGTVAGLRRVWRENRAQMPLLAWLAGLGLTHFQIGSVLAAFGGSAHQVLRSDPYKLAREIRELGFREVDALARRLGVQDDAPERVRAGLEYWLRREQNEGHCWSPRERLLAGACELLQMDDGGRAGEVLQQLLDGGDLAEWAEDGQSRVALPELFHMERQLAGFFARGGGANPHFAPGEELDALLAKHATGLHERQLEAVQMALRHSLTLMTGSAGSGKSHTIATLARLCAGAGHEVALAAPTGKAARRLEELCGREAHTIHRLLGYNGQHFSHHRENPLEAQVLVVDEFSMVDVELAWRLFDAVDLDKTCVLLVGDHNQLPSIGPGNILRDLVRTRAVPTVVLDKVVRQAGVLKANCIAILDGQVPGSSAPQDGGRRDWNLYDGLHEPEQVRDFVMARFDNWLDTRGEQTVTDVQVLSPTRKGPLGTVALNAELQRMVQRKLWGAEVPGPGGPRAARFLERDKVIQTRNNYDLDIMNGTIGYVVRVPKGGGLVVAFDGQDEETRLTPGSPDLRDLELAYALTIHKTQGSEFPCALVLIHNLHGYMHHRNLLYTGVTRAQRTAFLLGDGRGIRHCVQTRKVDERRTLLPLFLGGG